MKIRTMQESYFLNPFAMLYHGKCHCGAVKYDVELDLSQPVMECNCSYCQIKGLLLSFTAKENFTQVSWENNMTEYRFNTHKLSHPFCNICGVQCFATWVAPNGVNTAAINVRTLENIDLASILRFPHDGKNT